MIRRLPLIPTVIVIAAVATMIALGIWQLQRRDEKAQMIARFERAAASDAVVDYPPDRDEALKLLYRRARLDCTQVSGISSMAGQSAQGQSGLAITAQCGSGEGDVMVVLGWSQRPVTPKWTGGPVEGVIAPGPRLVADPPLAGLAENAVPDASSISDNHLAYALQWFFFAFAAAGIYVLAVRKRLAERGTEG